MNNPLELSDEEFMKLNGPPVVEEETQEEGTTTTTEEITDEVKEKVTETEEVVEEKPEVIKTQETTTSTTTEVKPKEEVPTEEKIETEQQNEGPDYKAFYDQIMAPFNANGKTIQLNSAEEAIQMMQMGANYTRKMQSIAPHRKVLMMLENNGLLDEGKLSFLIDLDKKDPEAIKKLIKDAGIEPMEIDTSTDSQYQQGNHTVSDNEANFRTNLEDLKSTQGGLETIQSINSWDQASKQVLWDSPELMTTIHQQRQSGVYDRIANEIARRQAIGAISANTPFLQAYQIVGQEIQARGGFNDLVKQPPAKTEVKTPVATTVTKPKPNVTNGDKAKATAPSRTVANNKASTAINPLAMSDEDFLKQMANRV